ncbi:hypothetical protein G2W53_012910 [Senna tora]|uniref:Uncharacterized protein n=1 Tax=Senna tora TaxID=362788 RepID=A0A834TZU6_9FABA|nr:hypothetical protein G2W53_012910 [Senna tora]
MMKKNVLGVVGIMMLVLTCELGSVHCRLLRSEVSSTKVADGFQDYLGNEPLNPPPFPPHIMPSFTAASSNTYTTRTSLLRTLASSLASGPSTRGRGH